MKVSNGKKRNEANQTNETKTCYQKERKVINMNETLTIISIVSGVVGLLIIYTRLVFSIATLNSKLQENTTILTKIELLLSNYDERIDDIDSRLIKLEAEHHMTHMRRSGDIER